MDVGVYPEEGASIEQVIRLTDGIGADGVIITEQVLRMPLSRRRFKCAGKRDASYSSVMSGCN